MYVSLFLNPNGHWFKSPIQTRLPAVARAPSYAKRGQRAILCARRKAMLQKASEQLKGINTFDQVYIIKMSMFDRVRAGLSGGPVVQGGAQAVVQSGARPRRAKRRPGGRARRRPGSLSKAAPGSRAERRQQVAPVGPARSAQAERSTRSGCPLTAVSQQPSEPQTRIRLSPMIRSWCSEPET